MKVLVIGDLMVDRYVYGKADKVSPEAPVLVFSEEESRDVVGGAGNVALNLKRLGADVTILGCATDYHRQLLANEQINVNWLHNIKHDNIKLRYIDKTYGQQLIRIDNEQKIMDLLGPYNTLPIMRRLDDWNLDAIIFSDYNKGCLDELNTGYLLGKARELNIMTIVDTRRSKAPLLFKGVDYMTPNIKEYNEIREANFLPRKAIVRTESEKGMTLCKISDLDFKNNKTGEPQRIYNEVSIDPIFTDGIVDVTGAGDTVTAAFTYFLANGCQQSFAFIFANIAAGLVCQKHGTATITLKEIEDYVKESSKYKHLWVDDEDSSKSSLGAGSLSSSDILPYA